MKKVIILFALLSAVSNLQAQNKTSEDVEIAYHNAMKGLFWVLDNIPEKNSTLRQNLIADDILYAKVKLTKEINGVKIESTGFYLSNEVNIKLFKSVENLIKEGFIKEKKTDKKQ